MTVLRYFFSIWSMYICIYRTKCSWKSLSWDFCFTNHFSS